MTYGSFVQSDTFPAKHFHTLCLSPNHSMLGRDTLKCWTQLCNARDSYKNKRYKTIFTVTRLSPFSTVDKPCWRLQHRQCFDSVPTTVIAVPVRARIQQEEQAQHVVESQLCFILLLTAANRGIHFLNISSTATMHSLKATFMCLTLHFAVNKYVTEHGQYVRI
jgi:hypothetical protein